MKEAIVRECPNGDGWLIVVRSEGVPGETVGFIRTREGAAQAADYLNRKFRGERTQPLRVVDLGRAV